MWPVTHGTTFYFILYQNNCVNIVINFMQYHGLLDVGTA